MKKIFTLCASLLVFLCADSQQMTELTENVPYEYNGLEYGYYVSNEKNKEVKGEDYERYEIVLYVTNKSGCLKLIPLSVSTRNNTEVKIAEFNCRNATGKRLTAKNGSVSARAWYTQVKLPNDVKGDKEPAYKFENAQAGHAIRNGETISSKIIVIVPKGERPKLNCRTLYLPEVQ